MSTDNALDNWLSSWPDALAFAVGLAVARWAGWNTGDLVWSLWLSSLVVGYSTIVWMICQPAAALVLASWRDRALVDSNPRTLIVFWLLLAVGVAFFLAFFTIHFVGFHYGHSQILISFFPIDQAMADEQRTHGCPLTSRSCGDTGCFCHRLSSRTAPRSSGNRSH